MQVASRIVVLPLVVWAARAAAAEPAAPQLSDALDPCVIQALDEARATADVASSGAVEGMQRAVGVAWKAAEQRAEKREVQAAFSEVSNEQFACLTLAKTVACAAKHHSAAVERLTDVLEEACPLQRHYPTIADEEYILSIGGSFGLASSEQLGPGRMIELVPAISIKAAAWPAETLKSGLFVRLAAHLRYGTFEKRFEGPDATLLEKLDASHLDVLGEVDVELRAFRIRTVRVAVATGLQGGPSWYRTGSDSPQHGWTIGLPVRLRFLLGRPAGHSVAAEAGAVIGWEPSAVYRYTGFASAMDHRESAFGISYTFGAAYEY